MATFYVDYESGGNANYSGDSFDLTLSGVDGAITSSTFSTATGGLTGLSGRYVSIQNAANSAYDSYLITGVTNDTTATIAAVVAGTALGNRSGKQFYIGGRWPNIEAGTAARIVSGDIIRIKSSPAPTNTGVNATWTDNSITVTLSSALTANVDLCETSWTASANVTCSTNATRKQGSLSCSFVFAAGFTTGKAAYKTISSTDYSGYKQLSFKFWSNTAIAASALKLCLCSDTTGDTPVDTFLIPAYIALSRWYSFTIDKGSALGSSIQSIALYADSDPGTPTILFDNIIACKDSTAADSLNHNSLIGLPTSSGAGGADTSGWYSLQSINGTTLKIDGFPMVTADAGIGYDGTTETVAFYKREPIRLAVTANNSTQQLMTIPEGGGGPPSINANPDYIKYTGGWNRTDMSTQTNETWFDGVMGYGQIALALSYTHFEKMGFARIRDMSYNTWPFHNKMSYVHFTACEVGLSSGGNAGSAVIIGSRQIACGNGSVGFAGGTLIDCEFRSTMGNFPFSNQGCRCVNCYFGRCSIGVSLTVGTWTIYDRCTFKVTAGLFAGSMAYFDNCTHVGLTFPSTPIAYTYGGGNSFAVFRNYNGNSNHHYIRNQTWIAYTDTSTVHSADSNFSWLVAPQNNGANAEFPVNFRIATVLCKANRPVTVRAWLRRNNSALTARLYCPADQVNGVSETIGGDISTTNAWEQASITVTPTSDGLLGFYAQTWYAGSASYYMYVDDISIEGGARYNEAIHSKNLTVPHLANGDLLYANWVMPNRANVSSNEIVGII